MYFCCLALARLTGMVFSQLYKQAEDVPVILSIDFDFKFLDEIDTKAQFKRPEQIFKYSSELERKIVREYEKRNPPAPTKPKFDSVLQPTPASGTKSSVSPSPPESSNRSPPPKQLVSEFDQTSPDSPWDVKTSVKDDISELGKALEGTKISASARKAEEAAETYLPTESPEDKQAFIRAYERAIHVGLTEMDALRGFFLFQGNPTEILRYVDNFVTLRDLGFPQDRIDTALIGNENDQEKALEELMGS